MTFPAALDRIRRWRKLGRLMAALPAVVAVVCLLLLATGLADAWVAFEPAARVALVTALLAVVALGTLAVLALAARFSRRRGASLADRLSGSPRDPATAALGIDPSSCETPLARHLAERSLKEASEGLAALPAGKILPWRAIGLSCAAAVVAALPLLLLRALKPDAFHTVSARLLHPREDLPPWSPLRFTIDPQSPVVVYGGDLPLAVEVTGATLEHPVECLVKRPGSQEILRLPAYRESANRFSRTLESVTEGSSVAFASGKARSRWLPVELLLQPKVLAGRITVTPPSYAGNEAVTSPLDTNEIAAMEGSEVVLELTSNRPLSPSPLVFTPATTPGNEAVPQEISGETHGKDVIAFRWIVTASGKLSATLRDVRGTPAAMPVELSLRAVPDQPPVVDLQSPPRMLLATPSTKLPLTGRAEDDHALAKVQLVRTLEGFRDRARVVAPALNGKAFDFKDGIDLGTLGVSPGQTIELFLEASDHNPSLLGQGASEISRIHIITEEDYASRIRAQTTLAQFSARYRAIEDALRKARESLDAMDRAADVNDAAAAEAARKQAAAAHEEAAKLLDQLANDFPAFQLEQRLKDLAGKTAEDVRANLGGLGKFDANASEGDQRRAIREMRDRLGARQQEQEQLQQDARTIAEAGKLMEMVAKFRQIYATQESLSKRNRTIAEEIHKGSDQNRRLLPSLADTQKKNQEALETFTKELKERAESIHDPALAGLRRSSLEFLEKLQLADPGSAMKAAGEHGRLGVANDAYANAELARALLEGLMQGNEENEFAEACKNPGMKFSIPKPDVNETMSQLLQGLCQNPGTSPNQGVGGGGMGAGGTGPTGNAQPGFAAMDVPVLGPQRMQFDPVSLGAAGNGGGRPGQHRELSTAAETEAMRPVETPRITRTAPDPESIPEPYREAVKVYFSE